MRACLIPKDLDLHTHVLQQTAGYTQGRAVTETCNTIMIACCGSCFTRSAWATRSSGSCRDHKHDQLSREDKERAVPCVAQHDIDVVPLTVLERTSVSARVQNVKYVGLGMPLCQKAISKHSTHQAAPHSRWAVECTANAKAWGKLCRAAIGRHDLARGEQQSQPTSLYG